MKNFEYAAPGSVRDATSLLADTWGKAEVLAGGTDLLTSLKQHLIAPDRLVSLKNISDLKGIKETGGSVRIGAMTTLGELADHATIREHFPALVTAAMGVGSPQLMSMGTVGGDLCQRPRCWYYRNGFSLFAQQGDTSLAREGDNRYHAIFGNDGPALFVSPSSFGPVLITLGALLTAEGPNGATRQIPAAEFFQTPQTEEQRETVLKPNEILTAIEIPLKGLKNATYEVRHRHGLDWPYVTAAVAFQLRNGAASNPQIVLGHVAPVPWISKSASAVLEGAPVDGASAAKCGQAATQGARPLSQNGYKVQLVKTAVKRAVLAAAKA
jgi:xanthine dehydrogenase YagS FAD-binding subunit